MENSPIYRIEQQYTENGHDVFRIRLDEGNVIYKAHFPNNPITPGVIIVDTACRLLGKLTNRQLEISEVKNAKFLNVLSPLRHPEVEYEFRLVETVDNVVRTRVDVRWKELIFSTISFIANEEDY